MPSDTFYLIDLDSILEGWQGQGRPLPSPMWERVEGKPWWSEETPGSIPFDAPAGQGRARAVIALSRRLALGPRWAGHVTFDYLRRFAARLGPELEIALALDAPQAVAHALLRLLVEAPSPQGAGSWSSVCLVSRDRWLVGRMRDRIRQQTGVRANGIADDVWSWRMPIGVSVPRTHRPVTGAGAVAQRFATTAWSDPINAPALTPELVKLVKGWPVEVGAKVSLIDVARVAENMPHVVSQIGLTAGWPAASQAPRPSVRGVDRFTRYAVSGTVNIGDCDPRDGLYCQICEDPPWPVPIIGIEPSSLGAGTVFLRGPDAVVRTRVPFFEIRSLHAAGMLSQNHVCLSTTDRWLLDTILLAKLNQLATTSRVRHDVRFAPDPDTGVDLVAEVHGSPSWDSATLGPSAWWALYHTATDPLGQPFSRVFETSVRRIPEGAGLLQGLPELQADAIVVNPGAAVVLVSPILVGQPVQVTQAIAPGFLGSGYTSTDFVAILSHRHLPAGSTVACRPIQQVPFDRLWRRLPSWQASVLQELYWLPLVVPEDPAWDERDLSDPPPPVVHRLGPAS